MPYYPPQPDDRRKDPPKGHFPFRRALLCFSVLLISYGAVRLIAYGADWLSSRRTAQEMRDMAAAPEETSGTFPEAIPITDDPAASPAVASNPAFPAIPQDAAVPSDILPVVEYPGGLQVNPRIRNLRKKSEYIIGWLTMDDLDEPVTLKDNSFFLNHDAAGNRNRNGAIFMDEETGLMTRPYTIFLYGHNMKTGAMFGNLHKYEQPSYCSRHRILQFDTLYEEGQYAVFAVATIRLTPGTAGYVSLDGLNSNHRKTRQKALNALLALSVCNSILDVNEEDQLLLLITCVGDDNQRLVVAARRLRENETPENLTLNSR